jgi:hypothetical protein
MLVIDCSNGERAIFSGISLIGTGDEKTVDNGLQLRNNCKDFRISHSTFTLFGGTGLEIRGNARGVVDHCKFIRNYRNVPGYGVSIIGDGTWPALDLGTEHAVFVEDSYFAGNRHAVTSNNGSRYVFRYNTILDNRQGAAAIDAHGKTVWPRGSRSYEIYHNTVTNTIKRWAGIGIRGGDGVIFDNTINGTSHPILLWNDSSKPSHGGCMTHPCPDQTRELYIWNNTAEDAPVGATNRNNKTPPGILQEGREYFHFARPGYTPFPYPHPLTFPSKDPQQPGPLQ